MSTVVAYHLFCCDVHNLNRGRECGVSLETEGKTGGERMTERERKREERSSEDNRVKKTRLSGVCSPHKSDRGNGSVESAFYSHLQQLTQLKDLKH